MEDKGTHYKFVQIKNYSLYTRLDHPRMVSYTVLSFLFLSLLSYHVANDSNHKKRTNAFNAGQEKTGNMTMAGDHTQGDT